MLQITTGYLLQYLCIDCGELRSNRMLRWCAERGVQLETTIPYSSFMNPSERLHRVLHAMTRAMLLQAMLPFRFWAAARRHAVHLFNRLPTAGRGGSTPYYRWHGVEANMHHVYTFGCALYAKIWPVPHRLAAQARRCLYLGVTPGGHGAVVMDMTTHHVINVRDYTVNEAEFPFKPSPLALAPPPVVAPLDLLLEDDFLILPIPELRRHRLLLRLHRSHQHLLWLSLLKPHRHLLWLSLLKPRRHLLWLSPLSLLQLLLWLLQLLPPTSLLASVHAPLSVISMKDNCCCSPLLKPNLVPLLLFMHCPPRRHLTYWCLPTSSLLSVVLMAPCGLKPSAKKTKLYVTMVCTRRLSCPVAPRPSVPST
jgi:hypothetical protein